MLETGGMLHALIVGVDAFADSNLELLEFFSRANAEQLAAALEGSVGQERHITLLLDEDERATKGAISRLITEELPRGVGFGDAIILYFAAFGSPEIVAYHSEPSTHLVVHDTVRAKLHATIDMMSELSVWARRIPARLVAIVLDAPFNGMPGGRTFENPELRSGPRLHLDRISLERMAEGRNVALSTACTENAVAREDSACRYGVFAHPLTSS